MKRIGIMGGTFDPIHNGHLMLGKQAYEEYSLDKIWYMPSGQPPHKKDHKITPSSDRRQMVALAIQDFPFMELSDFELRREAQYTYTAETLKLLRAIHPDILFFFIIGADSLFQIEHWYHPEEIMRLATLLVASREYEDASVSMAWQISYLKKQYNADILPLHCPNMNISSVEIREMISQGISIEGAVPKAVEEYIYQHLLYHK